MAKNLVTQEVAAAASSRPRTGVARVSEAAEFLRMSRASIYAMMNDHTLESVRIRGSRRISWASLERVAAQGTVAAS
jgi:excisionase family DNA binding protein